MNFRTPRFDFRVVMLLALVFLAPTVFGADKEVEQVQRLTTVAQKGCAALLEYVRETAESAPLIYSQWYVDVLAVKNPKKAEVEQARREFGRVVLHSLEDMAPTLRSPADAQTRQEAATTLLDLADWFGEQPGYGNALLFSRLQDLATVPLAYLIADLSYPETNLVAMSARLVAFPDEVKRNARVLNTESPEPIFDVPSIAQSSAGVWKVKKKAEVADSVVNPLERTWYRKVSDIRKWQKEYDKQSGLPEGKRQRDAVPEALAFFVDDDYGAKAPKPFTTLNQWDKKYHRRLFLGLGGHNIGDIKAFLLFRDKVGSFPTNPPSWWKPGDGVFPTPTTAAFCDAWMPYRNEYGVQYSPASRVYEAIQDNSFYDEDTRKVKELESLQQANEALKEHGKASGQ
jgi:hypothetical protein